jgi:uncharacterized protein with von Willebrand factor type A (vWA) domain
MAEKARPRLYQLGKLLWVKSKEDEEVYQYHFNLALADWPLKLTAVALPDPKPDADQSATPDKKTPKEDHKQSKSEKDKGDKDKQPPEDGKKPQPSPRFTPHQQDLLATAPLAIPLATYDREIAYQQYLLTADYLPVTRRQMKQSWRYLRRMVREGPPVEIDVPATVRKIARDGFVLDPELRPRRINKATLLLLLDQNGSMAPFHELGRRLQKTVEESGRLGKVQTLYFHNVPPPMSQETAVSPTIYRQHNLFEKPECVQATAVHTLLDHFKNKPSVLIFSDAGAARGGWNEARIQNTARFLYQLKAHGIQHIAWLNPMPPERWIVENKLLQNSAQNIARFVPMFSIDRHGLQEAINVLRGRSTRTVVFE